MKIAMYGLRAIGQGSGGVEKAVEELSTRLVLRGHDVTVFCRTRYNPSRANEYKGVRLVNLPAIYTKHLEAITHSFLAASWATRHFDVVHVHAVGPALTSLIPRFGRRKVVATVHAMDWRREKWGPFARAVLALGARAAVAFPHRTIVVSRGLQNYFREQLRTETVFIPNGVTPDARRPIDRLRRFGVQGNDYLLFLGRLVPEKGCHLLISAFRQTNLSCRLLVAGDTSHTDEYLAALRRAAQGDNRIIFTGPLFGEDKEEAYSNALGLVFPSLLEGMPIVLLEAMVLGCPVLCSDIPENLEIVESEDRRRKPGVTTFSLGKAEDFPAVITEFVEQSSRLREEALAHAPVVAAQFNWDAIVTRTEEVYKSL